MPGSRGCSPPHRMTGESGCPHRLGEGSGCPHKLEGGSRCPHRLGGGGGGPHRLGGEGNGKPVNRGKASAQQHERADLAIRCMCRCVPTTHRKEKRNFKATIKVKRGEMGQSSSGMETELAEGDAGWWVCTSLCLMTSASLNA